MGNEILRMEGITKVYANGILANDQVTLSLASKEIHALAGENGAGKTTLMKVLFGLESMDSGALFINGERVSIASPTDAIRHGIGMVHQHFMLVPSLTVAENMVLGMEPTKKGFLDLKSAIAFTKRTAEQYELEIDPLATVSDLSVGMKQRVEILKTLARGSRILVLDEPTAVLTPQETKRFFEQLKVFREKGHTIIFISHKLNEIKQVCDRITIMRQGRSVGVYDVGALTEQQISYLMIGRDVALEIEKKPMRPGKPILAVRNLSSYDANGRQELAGVSFTLREGEILGVAGVDGNGQVPLVECVTGRKKPAEGSISLLGCESSGVGICNMRKRGLSYIPSDRLLVGSALSGSVNVNLIANRIDEPHFTRRLLLSRTRISQHCRALIREYRIKCRDGEQRMLMLSGGNIQKVVAARELSCNPKLVIADQPTRGIDVGATEFIRNKLLELRDEGCGVLLVSADLSEVMGLSDSLIVMSGGEITAYFADASKVDREELGLYMLGSKKQSLEKMEEKTYEKAAR